MKYQSLFSWENKKIISKSLLLKFLPSMLSINISNIHIFILPFSAALISTQFGIGGFYR